MRTGSTICLALFLLLATDLSAPLCLTQEPKTPTPEQSSSTSPNAAPSLHTAEVRFIAKSTEGQPIPSIKAEELLLNEHGETRRIVALEGGPDSSLTIGFLFDISGSRRTDLSTEVERNLARQLLHEIWRDGDLAFVIGFESDLLIAAKPTRILTEAEEGFTTLETIPLHGPTALYDAICAADPAHMAKRPGRRALVVLTDGEDNASHNTLAKALECAHIGGVQVFFVFLGARFSGGPRTFEKRARRAALQLGQETGGDVFEPLGAKDLPAIFEKLRADLDASYRARYELQSGKPEGKLGLSLTTPGTKVSYSIARITLLP